MREAMVIIHFVGFAMILGTSLSFFFLDRASRKMEKGEALRFTVNSMALTRMGNIGLVVMIISGGYLMTPYWKLLSAMPLLVTKLVLFLVMAALFGIIGSRARKARKGDAEAHLKKIRPLAQLTLLVAVAIVVLAVLVFYK
jgi:uncharacterized membrane protein